jgi:hypothetical protein
MLPKLLYTINYKAVHRVLEVVHENRHDLITAVIHAGIGMDYGYFVVMKKSGSYTRIDCDGATAGLATTYYCRWRFATDLPLMQLLDNEFDRLAVVYWVASQQTWKDLAEDLIPYLIAAISDRGDEETTAKRQRV